MPLDKKGAFHSNPQVARMHDAAPAMVKKPDPGMQGQEGKGHVELHSGPAPDGSGKFHTISQPGGEARGHESLHEAHHAINEQMGADGCTGDGNCEHGAASEDDGYASQDGEQGSGGGDADDEY